VSWVVIYDRAVQAELSEILAWYAERGPRLPQVFETAFDDSVRALIDRPFSFGIVFKDVRRVQVGRFPHGVFFRVHERTIYVLGVVHGSRSFDVLKERTP